MTLCNLSAALNSVLPRELYMQEDVGKGSDAALSARCVAADAAGTLLATNFTAGEDCVDDSDHYSEKTYNRCSCINDDQFLLRARARILRRTCRYKQSNNQYY